LKRYIFLDHEGTERVLRADSLNAAQAAAYRYVLRQSHSVAAAVLAQHSTKRYETLTKL